MEHRPFPKIPTALADDAVMGGRWVATEKIHGAQLVVATDGQVVQIGKRKAWLQEDEAFFGWQMLRNELSARVQHVHRTLGATGPVFLYGELFGGRYPHDDVPALPGIGAVQTGIWYAPDLRYAVFDILRVNDGDAVFMAHRQLEALAEEVGLMTPPRLGVGTRQELQRLPVRYDSKVAARLGLPKLAGNVAEGFVLKPDVELPASGRPVVKFKIPDFDDCRFDESRPFDADAHLPVDGLLEWAKAMVNPMRAASARSKVGEEVEAVLDEIVLDVWVDLESIFGRRMAMLTEAESEALRQGLTALATRVVDG
ncbi:MAG: RNA ligase family protein [Myxococcota bacterium]